MLNPDAKLNPDIFEEDVDISPSRDGFGKGLVEAAEKNINVVALTADLSESVRTEEFAKKFPDRFFQCGIAEQSMVSVAAGLAHMGKIPFAASYAVFSPGRNWEQIRTTICYNDQNVKIIGSHAGLTTGPDGGTHQALEDIAISRVLPRMVVICPCDEIEAKKATLAMAKTKNPTYLRLCREKFPIITTENTPFEIGKGVTLWKAKNNEPKIGIIVTGILARNVLKASLDLESEGIDVEVLNIHTIKPIDEKAIIELAKKTKAIVTVEEHQITGGLGGAVSEILSKNYPTRIKFIGVEDKYGQSGKGYELLKHYGLDSESIKNSISEFLKENN